MLIEIPFHYLASDEAGISRLVDKLGTALAQQLDPGPWEPPQISHEWDEDSYAWHTCHNITLRCGATCVQVIYSFGGSGRDGGGSFSLVVTRGGARILCAGHTSGGWRVETGDEAAIEALRAACVAAR